jgi:hypothetical protein
MTNDNRKPSSYARFTADELAAKILSHRGMIASIERELARRAEADKRDDS